jgi:hypothetical protein
VRNQLRDDADQTKLDLSGIKKIGADALRRKFKSKIDRLHQKRDAMMPQWWKEASKS